MTEMGKKCVNVVNQAYITNINAWAVDETFLGNRFVLFLVTNHKTRAILGYAFEELESYQQTQPGKGLSSDILLELYEKLMQNFAKPSIIHSDQKPTYFSTEIKQWATENKVQLSRTDAPRNNQVAESVNAAIKTFFLKSILTLTTNKFKLWRKSWPNKFKNIPIQSKIHKKEFRTLFFDSLFFNETLKFTAVDVHICEAIAEFNSRHNQKPLNSGFSRGESEKLNKFIVAPSPESAPLHTPQAAFIAQQNNQALVKAHNAVQDIKNSQHLTEVEKQKLTEALVIIQPSTNAENIARFMAIVDGIERPSEKVMISTIILGFANQISLYKGLENQNKELLVKLHTLQEKQHNANQMLEELLAFKKQVQKQQEEKELRRQKRLDRKHRQENHPFLYEYIPPLFERISNLRGKPLTKTRLKAAIVCLIVTGVRISEVLKIKVSQIMTLLDDDYLAIDRVKNGKVKKEAYLSPKGKKFLQKYRELFFQLILLTGIEGGDDESGKINYLEPPYNKLFLFSSNISKGKKPISDSFFGDQLNKILQDTPSFKERGIYLTSHSFRKGYILELWKDTGDMNAVRQAVGHKKFDTTANYAGELSPKELAEHIDNKIEIQQKLLKNKPPAL